MKTALITGSAGSIGHDLRYALSGKKLKSLGRTPRSIEETLKETVDWTLENKRWLM